jgi:hypothetical protein
VYLHNDNDAMVVSNCIFNNTIAGADGGAVLIFDSNFNVEIIDSTFIGTGAGYNGGAIYAYQDNTNLKVKNCVFRDTYMSSP